MASKTPNWRLSSTDNGDTQSKSLSFINQNLSSIPEFWRTHIYVEKVHLSNNPIKSIASIPSMPSLTELHLDDTLLSNLKDANELPVLKKITFFNAPLADIAFVRIMCRAVYPKLEYVNNIEISKKEIDFADKNKDLLFEYVTKGFQPISIEANAIKFINSETRKRKTVYLNYIVSFQAQKLNCIPINSMSEETYNKVQTLVLSKNDITNLRGLKTCQNLKDIQVDDTKFASFVDSKPQPSLESLSFQHTPLVEITKFYVEMAVIVFPTLKYVNKVEVTKEQRRFCEDSVRNDFKIKEKLLSGQIITETKPEIKLLFFKQNRKGEYEKVTPAKPIQNDEKKQTKPPKLNENNKKVDEGKSENLSDSDEEIKKAIDKSNKEKKNLINVDENDTSEFDFNNPKNTINNKNIQKKEKDNQQPKINGNPKKINYLEKYNISSSSNTEEDSDYINKESKNKNNKNESKKKAFLENVSDRESESDDNQINIKLTKGKDSTNQPQKQVQTQKQTQKEKHTKIAGKINEVEGINNDNEEINEKKEEEINEEIEEISEEEEEFNEVNEEIEEIVEEEEDDDDDEEINEEFHIEKQPKEKIVQPTNRFDDPTSETTEKPPIIRRPVNSAPPLSSSDEDSESGDVKVGKNNKQTEKNAPKINRFDEDSEDEDYDRKERNAPKKAVRSSNDRSKDSIEAVPKRQKKRFDSSSEDDDSNDNITIKNSFNKKESPKEKSKPIKKNNRFDDNSSDE